MIISVCPEGFKRRFGYSDNAIFNATFNAIYPKQSLMSQRNRSPINSSLATGLAMGMLGAIAFSGKAIIVKLAYQHGVDAITFLMLRMLLALPFFVAMAWWSGRAKAHTQPI